MVDKRDLTGRFDRIFPRRLEKVSSVSVHVSSTRNHQSEGSLTSNTQGAALTEKLDHSRNSRGILEQWESKQARGRATICSCSANFVNEGQQ